MKHLFSILLILIVTISFSVITMAQDGEAGAIDAEGGSKVIRIGILLPKVKLVEAAGEVEPEEALRSSYAVMLNSDLFEVVALKSRISSLALNEAQKLKCDYILKVDLEQIKKKRKSPFGGITGRIIRDTGRKTSREAANKVPYGGGTGERIANSTARSTIINTGYSMSDMKVKIKKNDKFSLEYNLTTSKGVLFYANKIQAKARKNNDGILMKIIEQSANDLVNVLIKNPPQ